MTFLVWFAGNRGRTEMKVSATSRTDAIALFAKHHGVVPSAYIQARKA